ncbi:sialidase family protein [Tumebacillus permanentifrigoris]|uniref:BNR repeat protein n=1 Tax=Tumebacillus permanentifrigoris TaxID=378543 RepID=A0A316DQ55_9BACL|nr:sialidase family protein [Tumebacillus permanentifrigoris]PWK05296.1 hypothetical protein C7459_12445 [Tumebacillus permanentifrigoris]
MSVVVESTPLDPVPLVEIDGTFTSDNGETQTSFFGGKVSYRSGGYELAITARDTKYIDLANGLEDVLYDADSASSPVVSRGLNVQVGQVYPLVESYWQLEAGRLKHYMSIKSDLRPPDDFLEAPLLATTDIVEFDPTLRLRADGRFVVGEFTASVLELVDRNGTPVFTLPTIETWDQRGAKVGGKYVCSPLNAGRLQIATAVEYSWLADQARMYPVIIDPTVLPAPALDFMSGARQEVRLSNGWLVAMVRNSSWNPYFFVSKDGGTTWTQLCYSTMQVSVASIASYGTKVYLLTCGSSDQASDTAVRTFSFDATTVLNNGSLSQLTPPSTAEAYVFGTCILVTDQNGKLWAFWSAQWGGYSQYNVRYTSSTDGGITWAALQSLTNETTNGINHTNVSAVLRGNGNPVVLMNTATSTTYKIDAIVWNGTTWTTYPVFNGGTYAQFNPVATVDASSDAIDVYWYGKDAVDSAAFNIRHSRSTDYSTFSAPTKITTGNTYNQLSPAPFLESSGKRRVLWSGRSSGTYDQIRTAANDGTGWGAPSDITANTTSSATRPFVVWSRHNLNNDDVCRFVYVDNNTIKSDQILPNTAPLAPSNLTRANYDATQAATLTALHNDTPGDYPSAVEAEFYDASNPAVAVWTLAKTGVPATLTFTISIPANKFTNGKTYQARVRTYDSQGVVSPWSQLLSFKCSAAPQVALVAIPANTVTGDTYTFSGTYSQAGGSAELSYRFKLYDSTGATLLQDSQDIPNSVATNNTKTFTGLQNNTAYMIEFTATSQDGIVASTGKIPFSVSYTPPMTPTVTAVNNYSNASVLLTWTAVYKNLLSIAQAKPVATTDFSSGLQLTIDGSNSVSSGGSLKMFAATSMSATVQTLTTARIPIVAGATYSFSAYLKTSVASHNVAPRIYWYNAAGALIGTSSVASQAIGSSWTRVSLSAAALPGAVSCYVLFVLNTLAAGQSIWIDQLQLEAGNAPTLWQAGSIPISGFDVYRRPVGAADSEWKRIAQGAISPYVDYTCSAGDFEYGVRSVSASNSMSDYGKAQVAHTFAGQWLIDEQNTSNSTCFKYNQKGASISAGQQRSYTETFARFPRERFGPACYKKGTLSALMIPGSPAQTKVQTDKLDAMAASTNTYLLKFSSGYTYRVRIAPPHLDVTFGGMKVDVSLDWTEVASV